MSLDSASKCVEIRADSNLSINVRTYSIGNGCIGNVFNTDEYRISFYKNEVDRINMDSEMNRWVYRHKSFSGQMLSKDITADITAKKVNISHNIVNLPKITDTKHLENNMGFVKRDRYEELEQQLTPSNYTNLKCQYPRIISNGFTYPSPAQYKRHKSLDKLSTDLSIIRNVSFSQNELNRPKINNIILNNGSINKSEFKFRLSVNGAEISLIDDNNTELNDIDDFNKLKTSNLRDIKSNPKKDAKTEGKTNFMLCKNVISKTEVVSNHMYSGSDILQHYQTGYNNQSRTNYNNLLSKLDNSYQLPNNCTNSDTKFQCNSNQNNKLSSNINNLTTYDQLYNFLELIYLNKNYDSTPIKSLSNSELIILCKIMKIPNKEIPSLVNDKNLVKTLFDQYYNGIESKHRNYKITNNKRFIFRKIKGLMYNNIAGQEGFDYNRNSRDNNFFNYYFKSEPEYLGLTMKEAEALRGLLHTYEESKIKLLWRFKKFTEDFSEIFFSFAKLNDEENNKKKLSGFRFYLDCLQGQNDAAIMNAVLPPNSLPLSTLAVKKFMVDFYNSFGSYLLHKKEVDK